MADPTPPPGRADPALADIGDRLRRLRDREAVQPGAEGRSTSRAERTSGLGLGMRISIELVTTVAVGAGLGYALDAWLGTGPVMMVVFLIFGGAAGVSNAYRVVRGLDDSVGLGAAIARKEAQDAAEHARGRGSAARSGLGARAQERTKEDGA